MKHVHARGGEAALNAPEICSVHVCRAIYQY